MTLFISSCNKELQVDEAPPKTSETEYLKFDDQDELSGLIKKLVAIENGSAIETKGGIITKKAKGFISIADLEKKQLATKGGIISDGIEEMTIDEFEIMEALLRLSVSHREFQLRALAK